MSAVAESNGPRPEFGHFDLLQSFDVKHAPLKIQKWRSRKTGLTVLLGSHPSPLTKGKFVVATEIFDDTGEPHTLEHLIFTGSKDYPHKGVLVQLANRAGARGVNAYTAIDHTAYTITAAGSAGFLRLLPIYVDHILNPTLSDAAYVNEVHHINGIGEDAGVVYCEMQGREHLSHDLLMLNIRRTLYPRSSAYWSETGGLTPNLRVLNNQMIREYHSAYYVSHNLCLIIDGSVPVDQLFKVLHEDVEPKIIAHQNPAILVDKPFSPPTGWKRPFLETPTSHPFVLEQSKQETILFMEHDESLGESYLIHSSASPLRKEFIEISSPYTTSLSFDHTERVNKTELRLRISDVPTKHLDKIGQMVLDKLHRIVKSEGIDMDRMTMVMRQQRRQLLSSIEKNVTDAVADAGLLNFLYGNLVGEELPEAFDYLARHAALEKWSEDDWKALLKQIKRMEAQRLEKRRHELGDVKLKELQRQVEAAKEECDRPVPATVLNSFPLIEPSDLTWIPVETAVNNIPGQSTPSDGGAVQRHVDAGAFDVPLQTHFAHVSSNFIEIHLLSDTIDMPPELRPYMSVMDAALFNLAVKRVDGIELSDEEVVNQPNEFTVSHDATFMFRHTFSEVFRLSLKAEKADFEKGLAWLRDVIQGSIFSAERLQVIVARMLQGLPALKREGDWVASNVAFHMAFDAKKSTCESCRMLGQLEFLPQASEMLANSPERFIERMEQVRQYLLNPAYLRLLVSGDILSITAPKKVLSEVFSALGRAETLKPLCTSTPTLSALGLQPKSTMALVPLASIEGSFSFHYAKGPRGDEYTWDHPDLPALTR